MVLSETVAGAEVGVAALAGASAVSAASSFAMEAAIQPMSAPIPAVQDRIMTMQAMIRIGLVGLLA